MACRLRGATSDGRVTLATWRRIIHRHHPELQITKKTLPNPKPNLPETHPRCSIAMQRPAGTPGETGHVDPTAPRQPQERGGGERAARALPARAHGMSNLTTRSSHIVYANRSAHVTAIGGATRSVNDAKSAPWQHEGAALPTRCCIATRKCAGTFAM